MEIIYKIDHIYTCILDKKMPEFECAVCHVDIDPTINGLRYSYDKTVCSKFCGEYLGQYIKKSDPKLEVPGKWQEYSKTVSPFLYPENKLTQSRLIKSSSYLRMNELYSNSDDEDDYLDDNYNSDAIYQEVPVANTTSYDCSYVSRFMSFLIGEDY